MKRTWNRIGALLAAGALCMALLAGCSSASRDETMDGGGQDGEEVRTFQGSDLGIKSDMELTFPFLGLSLDLPDSLEQRMDSGEILCQAGESVGDGAVDFAYLYWDVIPAEKRDDEFRIGTADAAALDAWLRSLERVGTIGVFRQDLEDRLTELTGCDTHTVLETSGGYLYVLSLREGGDAAAAEELRQAAEDMTVTEMIPFSGESSFEEPRAEISSLGEFTTQTITGETVTQEVFRGHKLTMINLFATWCTPCVQEIPELEKLSQAMADKGVQVIGVVLDTVDDNGEVNEEAVEKAKVLQERTGATYPFIMPDETNLNGRLEGIAAVPETFFVDENGSIVGETHVGAGDLEDWTKVVEAELAALEGAA